MLYSFITISSSFCGQYISDLPAICHHSICTNNNLQQTTIITQKTLLSSQHAYDKIKPYGQMEFYTNRGQTGFCSMKQEHLHCNSIQYYLTLLPRPDGILVHHMFTNASSTTSLIQNYTPGPGCLKLG